MAPIEMYFECQGRPAVEKTLNSGETFNERIKDLSVLVEGRNNGGVAEIKHDSQIKAKIYEVGPGEDKQINQSIIATGGKETKIKIVLVGK